MQDGIGQAPREGNLHRARDRARYRPRFLCDQQNEDDDDREDDCKVTPRAHAQSSSSWSSFRSLHLPPIKDR